MEDPSTPQSDGALCDPGLESPEVGMEMDDVPILGAGASAPAPYPPDDGSKAYQLYVTAQQDYDDEDAVAAIESSTIALDAAEEAGLPIIAASALCLKAKSETSVGLKEEGLACARQALKIAVEIGDKALEARALFAISFVSMESGDENQMEIMLRRSLTCARQASSYNELFLALNNLSHIHGDRAQRAKDAGNAIELKRESLATATYAHEALEIASKTNNWTHQVFGSLNLASAFYFDGQISRAQDLVSTCSKLARQHRSPRLMTFANLDEARLLAAVGDREAAIELISSDEHLLNCCPTDELRLRSHEALIVWHKGQKTFKQAVRHLEIARALERKIHNDRSDQYVRAISVNFEIKEARAEAKRLKRETAALAVRNQQLTQDKERLKLSAMRDTLTGLGNRRAANQALVQKLRQAQSGGIGFSVAYFDLDHFKKINDEFGHQIGDQVLEQLGGLFTRSTRNTDDVYRIGGEEFLLLIASNHTISGVETCDRVRRMIENHPWHRLDPALSVTASMGVSQWEGETDVDALVARADAALYVAKANGRNRVEIG